MTLNKIKTSKTKKFQKKNSIELTFVNFITFSVKKNLNVSLPLILKDKKLVKFSHKSYAKFCIADY